MNKKLLAGVKSGISKIDVCGFLPCYVISWECSAVNSAAWDIYQGRMDDNRRTFEEMGVEKKPTGAGLSPDHGVNIFFDSQFF